MLAIVIGNRSAETFKPLWQIVKGWQCFFYVTDGYVVYPQFPRECWPYSKQNIYDTGRRRKYQIKTSG